MSNKIEPEGNSGCKKFGLNLKLVFQTIKQREIFLVMLFFVLSGFLNPDFEEIMYYFLLDDCKLTKD